jgi:hypothetical protein
MATRKTRPGKKSSGKAGPKKPAKQKARAKPAPRSKAKPKAKAPATPATRAKVKPAGPAKAVATPKAGAESTKAQGKPARRTSKGSRRPTLLRRGPDGEILAPGDLLLPNGVQRAEEILYLFRGCAAAEHPVGEDAATEVFSKRPVPEAPGEREELARSMSWARERFERGSIEPVVPARSNLRRTFQGVVERARHRRREIGAFLRGLDLGRTETSHMDAHGEASLQSLMEWAARLENLTEADEPAQADYNQFHRGLDQLESTTEALIVDVEQTLRRLRDRLRS